MRSFLIGVLVLILCSCSKDSENEDFGFQTIDGTVYVDSIPTPDVEIEYGDTKARTSVSGTQTTWSSSTIMTDTEGKYHLEIKKRIGGASNYRVRAKNPSTLSWSDYYQGVVMEGLSRVHDFWFSSQ